MGEGGENEVEVVAVDAGDDVGQVDASGAGGVGQGCHYIQDSSFAAGQSAEAGGEALVVEPDGAGGFDADPGLGRRGEAPVEGADQRLDGRGQRQRASLSTTGWN